MTADASPPDRRLQASVAALPPGAIASIPTPLLREGDRVALVGAQLAAALVRPLAAAGFRGVAAEQRHPLLAGIPPEAPEYEAYGNGYGEIVSARAFRQLAERAARTFAPAEDRWHEGGRVVDPFRPNLRYPAASNQEFDVLAERHLNVVRGAFRRARVVLAALTTAEVWEARADGAALPHLAQHGAARHDPERHRIRMPDAAGTADDLRAAVAALRAINPGVEIVLMISPELPAATALPMHLLAAATLGKAVLRVAMEAAARAEGVHYFPALEIAQGASPGAPVDAAGAVPAVTVAAIADALRAISEGGTITFEAEDAPEEPAEPPSGPPSEPVAAEPVASEPSPPARQRRKRVQPVAVDAFTEIEAAEAKRREEQRKEVARLRALEAEAHGEEAPAAPRPATPTTAELREQRIAERRREYEARVAAREARQAALAEAALAREVRRAAAAQAAAAGAARRQRAAEAAEARKRLRADGAPADVAAAGSAEPTVDAPEVKIGVEVGAGPDASSTQVPAEALSEARAERADASAGSDHRRKGGADGDKPIGRAGKRGRRKSLETPAVDHPAAESDPQAGAAAPAAETGPETPTGKAAGAARRKRDRPAKA